MDFDKAKEWAASLPKCGCGRVGRYETSTGLACNKYMRCDNAEFMGTELEALRAENKVLKQELKEINAAIDDPAVDLTLTAVECIQKIKQQLQVALGELIEAQKDAERYRFLKRSAARGAFGGVVSDAAIDRAMFGEK